MYNFRILKVMTVCINTYARCDIFRFNITDLSQADFVKSTAYLLHYWHWLTNWAIFQSLAISQGHIYLDFKQTYFSYSLDKAFHSPEFQAKLFFTRNWVGGFYWDSLLILTLLHFIYNFYPYNKQLIATYKAKILLEIFINT